MVGKTLRRDLLVGAFIGLMLWLPGLLALAQQLSVSIKPNTPFTIAWDQAGEVGTKFRFWCDGTILKNFSAVELTKTSTPNADGTFTFTAQVPGLPAGNHPCFVSAYADEIGEAKMETPLVIPVGNIPAVPVRLKIVVSVGGGQ